MRQKTAPGNNDCNNGAPGLRFFSTGFKREAVLRNLLTDVEMECSTMCRWFLSIRYRKKEALYRFVPSANVSRIETWNGGRGVLQSKVVATTDGSALLPCVYNRPDPSKVY